MRVHLVAASFLLLIHPSAVHAQSQPTGGIVSRTEAALTFTAIRSGTNFTNTGQSGSFTLTGASATGAYQLRTHLSALVELSGTHVNGVSGTGAALTLITFQAGGRYVARPFHKVVPFGQVLVGEAHVPKGDIYPANSVTGGGADSVAITPGVGIDYPLNATVSLRGQADYMLTKLPNGGDNAQNYLRASGGFALHFGKH